jgi:hypothetical protein
MSSSMAAPTEISRIDLVPLPFAARMVYLLAYGVQLPAEHLSDRLNAMAYSLSTMATLYSLEGPSMRALSSEELSAGLFRNGAEEFHFIDSRPPVRQIGVTRHDIEKTAQGLLAIEAQAATGRLLRPPLTAPITAS